MKNQLSILFVMAVVLVGLSACKSTKDTLVGEWNFSETTTVDGVRVNISGTETMNDNGTFTDVADFTIIGETENKEGYAVEVKIGGSVNVSGDWTVNDDKEIVYSPTSSGVKVSYVKYYDPSDGSYLGDLTGNNMKYASNIVKEMLSESDLKKASTERIIMLQENKFVTESTDEDGTKTTMTYTR